MYREKIYKILKNKSTLLTLVVLCSVGLIGIGWGNLYELIKYPHLTQLSLSRADFYISTILLITWCGLLFQLCRLRALYFIIIVLGTGYIFAYPYPGPIDEGAHMAYIEHIIDNNKLPILTDTVDKDSLALWEHKYPNPTTTDPNSLGFGGKIYQAHQPPLYYLVARIFLGFFSENMITKLYALRFFGLFSILIALYFTIRTYVLAVQGKLIKKQDFLFYSYALLLTISPGFLLRMTSISNDHFLLVIFSVAFWYLIRVLTKHDQEKRQPTVNEAILLGMLLGGIVLTKLTAIGVPVILIGVLGMKKYWKAMGVATLSMIGMISPWVIWNIGNYHAFTGGKQGQEMVYGIVNPADINFDIAETTDQIFHLFAFFWTPQEMHFNAMPMPSYMLLAFLVIALMSILCASLQRIYILWKERKCATMEAQYECLISLPFISVVLFLGGIVWWSDFSVALGRYAFFLLPATVFLCVTFIQRQNKGIQQFAYLLGICSAVVLWNTYFFKLALDSTIPAAYAKRERTYVVQELGLQPNNNTHIAGGIQSGMTITQEFILNEKKLKGISIYFSTFQKEYRSSIEFILKSQDCKENLYRTVIKGERVKDNTYYDIIFPNSYPAGKYCFILENTEKFVRTPITIQFTAPDTYKEGDLVISKKDVEEKVVSEKRSEDAVFKLITQ